MKLFKATLILVIFSTLAITVGPAFAQSLPTGNPELDKRTYLQQGNPSITENGPCSQTCVGGVLWPTLVQVKNFLVTFTGGIPLIITGGSELDDHKDRFTGVGHLNGYKVDVNIANHTDTFADPLSVFVVSPVRTRPSFDPTTGAICRGDGAPLFQDFSDLLFAMEYPWPQFGQPGYKGPASCAPIAGIISLPRVNPKTKLPYHCCHWDIQSSYSSMVVTPDTLTLKLGESMPVTPAAMDAVANTITKIAWMFDYNFPSDPSQQIASIDPTGVRTGTAGNVMGVSVGSSELLVSEGPYYGLVQVTVNPPDPPSGGPVCQGLDQTKWKACWEWDSSSNSWLWYPGSNQPTPPNPNSPPVPGGCSGNSAQNVPPIGCWVWDPTANNGAGAWIFIRPQGGGGTTTTWPVTPVGSYDPNDITGLPGVGNARYLTNASPFTYLIQFENLAAATAPAQQVTVTDTLNAASFDLSTVTLGPISFPGQVVTPPAVPLAALGNFSTDVDLRPSTNLIVRVSASLNLQSGVLSWSMASLDPATLQPPTDPLAGFLPPGADGSVSLVANAKSALASGTTVSDQASIIFDLNPAIATPVWSNTIDSTPPVSSVSALPATESSANFPVAWQGTDSGSGIQDFTVFASDNRGPFSAWLVNTTLSSATFFGQWGHTYAFYSIARDVVGNIESAKTIAETTTQVIPDPIPPTTTATLFPQPNAAGWNNSNVTVNLTSFDNPGGPGVKQITYSATGAQPVGSTTLPTSFTSFIVSVEGITTITFFATDNVGNVESAKTITIQLDKTPPTITGMRTPAPNANGWNDSPVTVSFRCTDNLSGLAAGSPPAPTVLSAEGAGQSVTGTCLDVAGNSATSTVSGVNIDKTPPVITASANPATLWPPNGKMVPVTISGTMTDNLSGVNPSTASFAVKDSYGLVQPSGLVSLASNGTYSFTIALEARRDGQDKNGRPYTVVVSAQDNAGNAGSATTTVVVPHDQGN